MLSSRTQSRFRDWCEGSAVSFFVFAGAPSFTAALLLQRKLKKHVKGGFLPCPLVTRHCLQQFGKIVLKVDE